MVNSIDKTDKQIPAGLPVAEQERLAKTFAEIDGIFDDASSLLETKLTGAVSFRYRQSAPLDILSPFERAQSVCFIIKYENIPMVKEIEIQEYKGKFYLKNIGFIRHVLNEFRPIIKNQDDSIYFSKIHKFCHSKLMNKDPKQGLSVTVEHIEEGDVTERFVKILGERNKAIRFILEKCEYDYVYNGILQHSDHQFTTRFWKEYSDGTINHVFIKHAYLLGHIHDCLTWHYAILNHLTFPKLGPI